MSTIKHASYCKPDSVRSNLKMFNDPDRSWHVAFIINCNILLQSEFSCDV